MTDKTVPRPSRATKQKITVCPRPTCPYWVKGYCLHVALGGICTEKPDKQQGEREDLNVGREKGHEV
jgi:hypothetical protein